MKCDICGATIPKCQGEQEERGQRSNQGPSLSGRWAINCNQQIKTVVNVCPGCVKKQDRREVWMWVLLGIILVGGLVTLFGVLFQNQH